MTTHARELIDNLFDAEPADGSRLVVHNGDNEWHVIWRDDAAAERWEAAPGDHWFAAAGEDPMALYEHLKYAEGIYNLGAPIAELRTVEDRAEAPA